MPLRSDFHETSVSASHFSVIDESKVASAKAKFENFIKG